MKVAIPAEADSEPRVAATPDTVKKLKAYADVVVQSGAGRASGVLDSDYEAAGATIAQGAADTLHDADVVLKVRRPTEQENHEEPDHPFCQRQEHLIRVLVLGVIVAVRRCVFDLAVVGHVVSPDEKMPSRRG